MATRKKPAVEFGRVYRDHITGFTGKCTGKVQYISGCDQVLLMPTVDEKGDTRKGEWFDDERLIDVEAAARVQRTSRKGGPQQFPAPVR